MESQRPPSSSSNVSSGPRRAYTSASLAPDAADTASASSGGQQPPDTDIETLYNHPNVKITAFAAGARSVSQPSRSGASVVDVEPGSLSWSSQLERTLAVGPFRIYRAPGSVAFLSCGSALQPIFPKSQAWCVDEASSKFVLQIRRPQYWRMEVPVDDDEDIARSQLLREVLDKILLFEKTPCPFRRTFHVELPEAPGTPVRRRPWTPREGPSVFPITPESPDMAARLWMAEKGTMAGFPKDWTSSPEWAHPRRASMPLPEHEDEGEQEPAPPGSVKGRWTDIPNVHDEAKEPRPLRVFGNGAAAAKNSAEGNDVSPRSSAAAAAGAATSSKVQTWHPASPPLPPSPPMSSPGSPRTFPFPHDKIVLPPQDTTRRDGHASAGEQSGTPVSPHTWATNATAGTLAATPQAGRDVEWASASGEEPKNGSSDGDSEATSVGAAPRPGVMEVFPAVATVATTTSSVLTHRPRSSMRPRATTSSSISRRALSPLPAAANLLLSNQTNSNSDSSSSSSNPSGSISDDASQQQLSTVIVNRAFQMLITPPAYLIALMLRVAARILAGEWRGVVFGRDDRGEAIPVQWDWSEQAGLDQFGLDGDARDENLKARARYYGKDASNDSSRSEDQLSTAALALARVERRKSLKRSLSNKLRRREERLAAAAAAESGSGGGDGGDGGSSDGDGGARGRRYQRQAPGAVAVLREREHSAEDVLSRRSGGVDWGVD